MIRISIRLGACFALACVLTAASSGLAGAHEHREVAGHEIVVGWRDEPAFAGFKNGVSFRVTEGGKGIEGLEMKVEVIFGDRDGEEKSAALELSPAFRDPGHYTTSIIPTRSGEYTFHIIGQLGNEVFDQFFTSGEETFDNIGDPAEVQFPAKDPSAGELAALSKRLSTRVDNAGSEVEEATDQASLAQSLSYAGIGAGVVALILAALSLARARRRT